MGKRPHVTLLSEFIMGMHLADSVPDATVGHLSGNIAHELRNLFGVMSACAQVIGESPDDHDLITMCATRIQDSAERATRIVSGFSRLARTDASDVEDIVLKDLVDDALGVMGNQFAAHQITVQSSFAPQPALVRVHTGLGMQLIVLLISVCLEHARYGAVLSIITHPSTRGMELVMRVENHTTYDAPPSYDIESPELIANRLDHCYDIASKLSAELVIAGGDASDAHVWLALPCVPLLAPIGPEM